MSEPNPGLANWKNVGASDENIRAWAAEGLTADDWAEWRETGLPPAIVKRMKGRGVSSETISDVVTRQRQTAASDYVFIDAVEHADTRIINTYLERSWTDDAAVEWARAGVDASLAGTWVEIGIDVRVVHELRAQGDDLASFVRAWWGAGIPLTEVASWVAAGFNARDAAEARLKGVTPAEPKQAKE
jgi:hypothetical protein